MVHDLKCLEPITTWGAFPMNLLPCHWVVDLGLSSEWHQLMPFPLLTPSSCVSCLHQQLVMCAFAQWARMILTWPNLLHVIQDPTKLYGVLLSCQLKLESFLIFLLHCRYLQFVCLSSFITICQVSLYSPQSWNSFASTTLESCRMLFPIPYVNYIVMF